MKKIQPPEIVPQGKLDAEKVVKVMEVDWVRHTMYINGNGVISSKRERFTDKEARDILSGKIKESNKNNIKKNGKYQPPEID